MILGPISLLDCLVFVIFLIPQLLLHVGLGELAACGFSVLPYLALRMPYQLVQERYFISSDRKSPFSRKASFFSDLVIRCVRYAFAYIPASIGRVFFSKNVALPFFYFRMFRHGIFRCPVHWEEVRLDASTAGIWMIHDPDQVPDVVVYYCHGGGFSMGSSYFYIEFLLAWLALLKDKRFSNPAVFTLEYTLVPEATYPAQTAQTLAGYKHMLDRVAGDASRICLAGDSAGATLMLSLLLVLASSEREGCSTRRPGFVTMISPWCTLVSDDNRDTPSDYLNADSLHMYARQYLGRRDGRADAQDTTQTLLDGKVSRDFASPGECDDIELWTKAVPANGIHWVYGAEEVFRRETRKLINTLKVAGVSQDVTEEPAGIHAWPVVNLFLADSRNERLKGLVDIVNVMSRHMSIGKDR